MAETREDLLKAAWTATNEYGNDVPELMWVACWGWCAGAIAGQIRLVG
jgi:hypothetical protein